MDQNNHTMTDKNNLGKVRIDNDVVGVIAALAIKNIKGIYSVGGGMSSGISGIFGRKNYNKGIKINIEEDNVTVDVNIDATYGVKIPDLSKEIQETIKEAIENMTGLSVINVNVYIQRVRFQEDQSE